MGCGSARGASGDGGLLLPQGGVSGPDVLLLTPPPAVSRAGAAPREAQGTVAKNQGPGLDSEPKFQSLLHR